jgi:hypothetical protein
MVKMTSKIEPGIYQFRIKYIKENGETAVEYQENMVSGELEFKDLRDTFIARYAVEKYKDQLVFTYKLTSKYVPPYEALKLSGEDDTWPYDLN